MKAVIAVPHGTPIEIWFADEARVGQQGTLTRIWARRGSRPPAPRDRGYISAYLFGAVCPDRRTGAAVVMPEVNTDAMEEHLPEASFRLDIPGHSSSSGGRRRRRKASAPTPPWSDRRGFSWWETMHPAWSEPENRLMTKPTEPGSPPSRTTARRAPGLAKVQSAPRPGGRLGLIIGRLSAKRGATADELVAETGWQRHSVLGALSKLKARGFAMRLERQAGPNAYRLDTSIE